MSGLAGFEYAYSLDAVSLHLQALSDVTGVHEGQEVRMALMFPWQWGEQRWALTLGANYKNRQILDYYYGVSARDVADATLFYAPASAGLERLLIERDGLLHIPFDQLSIAIEAGKTDVRPVEFSVGHVHPSRSCACSAPRRQGHQERRERQERQGISYMHPLRSFVLGRPRLNNLCALCPFAPLR